MLVLRDSHEDATVKAAAAEALAKFRDPRAVPFLVRELPTRRERVAAHRRGVGALRRGSRTRSAGVARRRGPRLGARLRAARILGHVGAAAAVEPLMLLLHARNDLLRIAAAAALGELRDRRALQPLVQATLRDPAPQVRAHAAGAVARIEAEGAVDVLVAALAGIPTTSRVSARSRPSKTRSRPHRASASTSSRAKPTPST